MVVFPEPVPPSLEAAAGRERYGVGGLETIPGAISLDGLRPRQSNLSFLGNVAGRVRADFVIFMLRFP